jgi:FliI/YscN family ATPase
VSVLSAEFDRVGRALAVRIVGRVVALRGLTVRCADLPVPVGSLVRIGRDIHGEVVGFDHEHAIVMVLAHTAGVRPGDAVEALETAPTAPVGPGLLGRIVDGLGRPIDHRGVIHDLVAAPLDPAPLGPMSRGRIDRPLVTGVRALDLMTPVGRGQRLGIFAGPGVGKSTLLGQIARGTEADATVIALIGERGREVREFVEEALGAEGLARAIVVVATGDESPLMRLRAAKLACTAAEHLRDRGMDVLLMMDSVTRFAHAQRQVGLSIGEPPATKGYTPSVFAHLGLLLERAGAVELPGGRRGSVTGLYTILVEGDDTTEPISDAARGILDGHVMLSRKLAQKGHYPAIDALDSISRVAGDVTDTAHRAARQQLIRILAAYREVEELVQIGAYARGSNAETDIAIDFQARVNELLRQGTTDVERFEDAKRAMVKLAMDSGEALQHRTSAGPRQAGVRATA